MPAFGVHSSRRNDKSHFFAMRKRSALMPVAQYRGEYIELVTFL